MVVAEVRVELKKGVADPEGKNTLKALELLGFEGLKDVKTVKVLEIHLEGVSGPHDPADVERPVARCAGGRDPDPAGDQRRERFRSLISKDMNELYDRYLGPRWREEAANRQAWEDAARIPAEELWRTHERRRERLVAFARRRLRFQLERRAAPRHEIELADSVLNSETLTIGFARRFVDYKRATLLLHDVGRLGRIVNDPQRPVQVVFAGKAHPHDDTGKEIIQRVVQLARLPEFRRRIVFLEDADMALARPRLPSPPMAIRASNPRVLKFETIVSEISVSAIFPPGLLQDI